MDACKRRCCPLLSKFFFFRIHVSGTSNHSTHVTYNQISWYGVQTKPKRVANNMIGTQQRCTISVSQFIFHIFREKKKNLLFFLLYPYIGAAIVFILFLFFHSVCFAFAMILFTNIIMYIVVSLNIIFF